MVPVHSATVYPNIVPQNDLRLLDALTIKHGPTRLLARFMLEGDKMARGVGLHLRLRHDFDELLFINRKEAARGSWYPLVDAFNPECTELTPENAFWISGTDDSGEIVVTWAARIYNWIGTNLAEQARALWFGRDLGQPCVVTAPAASMISGVTVCGGALASFGPDGAQPKHDRPASTAMVNASSSQLHMARAPGGSARAGACVHAMAEAMAARDRRSLGMCAPQLRIEPSAFTAGDA